MNRFAQTLLDHNIPSLQRQQIHTLQINLGYRCNLACSHCHVQASPARTECMSWETMEQILTLAAQAPGCQVDLTGGAPEMNPDFTRFVTVLRAAGHPVQVRTNLSILLQPGFQSLPGFFRENQVQLVASLPCYLNDNVDAQRGEGTYRASVDAIRRLNKLGYGKQSDLPLNLVYNPAGPFLPPGQEALEADYRTQLRQQHGIEFTHLLTLSNMAIGRFRDRLQAKGELVAYEELLRDNFNAATLEGVMCRHQLSIGWDGTLADCDFNQVLDLPTQVKCKSLADLKLTDLEGQPICTGDHCFACTAGAGSSCGGSLVA